AGTTGAHPHAQLIFVFLVDLYPRGGLLLVSPVSDKELRDEGCGQVCSLHPQDHTILCRRSHKKMPFYGNAFSPGIPTGADPCPPGLRVPTHTQIKSSWSCTKCLEPMKWINLGSRKIASGTADGTRKIQSLYSWSSPLEQCIVCWVCLEGTQRRSCPSLDVTIRPCHAFFLREVYCTSLVNCKTDIHNNSICFLGRLKAVFQAGLTELSPLFLVFKLCFLPVLFFHIISRYQTWATDEGSVACGRCPPTSEAKRRDGTGKPLTPKPRFAPPPGFTP
uniref:Pleckstrin homology and RhoGEF domain containing G6 n=1 Tax=Macaca fascicularis TaxID=9541 RepID=A0A7N9DAE9_MACFA